MGRAAVPDTPYISEIVTLRVDAAHLDGNPATALAGALHASLARTFPALAAEAARAARDPHAAASDALERLDASRRKLEAEKRALDDANARRARLDETILYQTAGSQVDAYARANTARLKGLLSNLGIAGDPLLAYKDMVQTIASTPGWTRRAGFVLRAFFAFKGQRKLIATAFLLLFSGAGLGFAIDEHTAWLSWLRANESSVSIANWLEAHMDLLASLREIIFLGAAIALGVNVWRASRLLQLVFRGEALLQADLAAARRETDRLFAHQARRVENLAAEVNSLSRLAAEAETWAGDAHPVNSMLAGPSLFAIDTATQQAQAFAAAVGAMIARPRETRPGKSGGGAPGRIVLAFDHLDAVPASRGREILVYARALFNQGFVLLIAADPARLAGAAGETAPSLDKWIQVPFQIGEITSRANYANSGPRDSRRSGRSKAAGSQRRDIGAPGTRPAVVRRRNPTSRRFGAARGQFGPRIEAIRQPLPPHSVDRPESSRRARHDARSGRRRHAIRDRRHERCAIESRARGGSRPSSMWRAPRRGAGHGAIRARKGKRGRRAARGGDRPDVLVQQLRQKPLPPLISA